MGSLEPEGLPSGQKKDEGLKNRSSAAGMRTLERETTDMALFVRTSSETILDWNRQRIVDALMRETTIDGDTAERVSREVEDQILSSKISLVTAPLIRELVDAKLIEYGLEEARKAHTRLGVPLYDVDQLILHPNRENANVPHGPEATNLTLAERIKKEYALLNVFSQDVGDAHRVVHIRARIMHTISSSLCQAAHFTTVHMYTMSRYGVRAKNAICLQSIHNTQPIAGRAISLVR